MRHHLALRTAAATVAVAVLAAGLVACSGSGKKSPSALENVSLAVTGSGEVQVITATAQAQGFFKQQGLKVSVKQLSSTLAVDSVEAGQVDYDLGAGVTPDLAALKGQPIRTYSVYINRESFVLIGRPGGVSSIDGLRGKTIVGSGATSANDIVLGELLRSKGGGLASSVKMLDQSAGSTGQIALLQAGKVDAAVVDYSNYLSMPAGYPILYNFADESSPIVGVYNGVVTTPSYAKKHPKQVSAMIEALFEASQFASTNETATLPLIASNFKLSNALAKKAFDNEKGIFSPSPKPTDSTMAAQMAIDQRVGKLSSLPTSSRVYDFSMIPSSLTK